MRYSAGISGDEYGAMEDGYEQGHQDGKKRALRPFQELFSRGPDTACRTTWHDGVEYVEVPMGLLRAAFDRAEL